MSASAIQRSETPSLPQVGQVLDRRFELLDKLGEGGMGHVFRARDRQLDRVVALKLITPRYLGRSDRERRFLRELDLGRRAEAHRSLVHYHEGGRLQHHRWPFLVMELVPGRDLARRLAHGPLEPPVAVRLARQVAGAVQTLHRAGIVHRDVTTMNVLVDDGDAVLVDLSHACEFAAPQLSLKERERLTREYEVPGTHHYMPPEQARAEPAHPAMDVYAFGVMLVHMLTGVAPGKCDRAAFIELQREGKVQPPRIDTRVYTEVPLPLAELVDACVTEDCERRPTMDEVVRRLDQLLVVMTTSVVEDGTVVAANERMVSTQEHQAEGAAGPSRAARRGSLVWLLSAAMLGATLMWVLGSWVTRSVSPSDEPEARLSAEGAAALPTGGDGVGVREQGRDGPVHRPGTPSDSPVLESDEISVVQDAVPSREATPAGTEIAPEADSLGDGSAKTAEPSTKRPREARRPHRRPPTPRAPAPEPTPEPACEEVRAQAIAARRARSWTQVVQLTRSPRCWDDANARLRLRLKAFSELARHGDCVKLGSDSTDTEVKRLVAHCARRLEGGAP